MKRLVLFILALCFFTVLFGKEYVDTAIYQGLYVKVDIGNAIFEMTRSKMNIQSYEVAVNMRLKNRFFPALEGGYATAKTKFSGGMYDGNGVFLRAGLDIYPLRDSTEASHILIGVRYANALQKYKLGNVATHSLYWDERHTMNFSNNSRYDGWLEIVVSLQAQVYKNFYMGWALRFKILFTEENNKGAGFVPTYIPGFGYRDGKTNYGFNYYIGVKI